jgi:hypothetical protein
MWLKDAIEGIAASDDLHISPFREDGVTYGRPTWIWSVVVGEELYVRAYYGQDSGWYRAAISQGAGRITAASMTKEVTFAPVTGPINDRVDHACREKYRNSPYVGSMTGAQARAATLRVAPRSLEKSVLAKQTRHHS